MRPAWSPIRSQDLPAGWIGLLLRPLNRFLGDVASLLGGGLLIGDNIRGQVDTLSFTTDGTSAADSFPIDLDVRMGAIPSHVICTRVIDLDNQDATFTSGVSWRMNNGQIRILLVSGLSVSRRYQITLLSLP